MWLWGCVCQGAGSDSEDAFDPEEEAQRAQHMCLANEKARRLHMLSAESFVGSCQEG